MSLVDDVLAWARKCDPYPYVFGAELSGSTPGPADCSELVEYACRNAGVSPKVPDGSGNQFFHCYNAGLAVPLDQAIHTPGALLFYSHTSHYPPPNSGRDYIYHVAFSLGDGVHTFEARSESYGIYQGPVGGRSWYGHGGLIPGVHSGGTQTPPEQPPAGGEWDDGMRTLYETSPRLQGDDVKACQFLLLEWGFVVSGGADGVYGPGTAAAVREFQASRGLTVDGQYGDKSRRKANGG